MRPDIIAEVIFMAGILLTIISLVVFGLILKRLLNLIGGKGIWIFPIIGSIFLVAVAGFHIYRMVFYFPLLSVAGPGDLFELIVGSLGLARLESFLFLGAGIFPLIGGILYYSASSK
ncbi:MAG: hypothetical protein ABIL39_06020 [candidate division WOR-3 bacterium]